MRKFIVALALLTLSCNNLLPQNIPNSKNKYNPEDLQINIKNLEINNQFDFNISRIIMWEVTKERKKIKTYIVGLIPAKIFSLYYPKSINFYPDNLTSIFNNTDKIIIDNLTGDGLIPSLEAISDEKFDLEKYFAPKEWNILNLLMNNYDYTHDFYLRRIKENELKRIKPRYLLNLLNKLPNSDLIGNIFSSLIGGQYYPNFRIKVLNNNEILANFQEDKIEYSQYSELIKDKIYKGNNFSVSFEKMVENYNKGNLDYFEKLLSEEQSEYYSKINRITKEKLLNEIKEIDKNNYLIVTGLNQILGKKGLIKLLESQDFTVKAHDFILPEKIFSDDKNIEKIDVMREYFTRDSEPSFLNLLKESLNAYDKDKNQVIDLEEYINFDNQETKSFIAIDDNRNNYLSFEELRNFYFRKDGLKYRLKVTMDYLVNLCDKNKEGKVSASCGRNIDNKIGNSIFGYKADEKYQKEKVPNNEFADFLLNELSKFLKL